MLVLCTYANRGTLCAQIHSISSSRHHSYTNGGAMVSLPSYEFGSTSVYGNSVSRRSCYSTAPMHVANGTIKTMASTIKGGVLLDDLEDSSSLQRIRGRQNTICLLARVGMYWDYWLYYVQLMHYTAIAESKVKIR